MRLGMIRAQGGDGAPDGKVSLTCARHEIAEWIFHGSMGHDDPFGEIELDAVVIGPRGHEYRVPAFWAGGDEWRIRFSPPEIGRYKLRTICSDTQDLGLHGREGDLTAVAHDCRNPLLEHGPLQEAGNGRHLEHEDGLPFFWLADTWWLGLTQRLDWPRGFQDVVSDRRAKGFNVIQLLAGLFCDMPAHDERGANEGGLAWEPGYARINPAFFDWADLRIDWLAGEGLVPCLFGSWSFHLLWMGLERMKQHWRYLIARYGAYPVVWCLAGGGTMPYYVSKDRDGDQRAMRRDWSRMAHYVAALDPYQRPLALHPTPRQGGCGGLDADVPHDLRMHRVGGLLMQMPQQDGVQSSPGVASSVDLAGKLCFPGMLTVERHELHRPLFWISALAQASGFTYGVNGMWQFNSPGQSFGPSPTGRSWPDTQWDEALHLASSHQVGWSKGLLQRYRWQEFRSHPEWVVPHAKPGDLSLPHAAGIPAEVRIIYFPQRMDVGVRVRHLEANLSYRAKLYNPRDCSEASLGWVTGQSDWDVPMLPDEKDWLVVMERVAI